LSRQELVVECLAGLAEVTRELCCLLTQPDASSAALRSMNFVSVKTIVHFSLDFLQSHPCPQRARALLVVQVGLQLEEQALRCIGALSKNATAPAILVLLLILPDELERRPGRVALPEELARARVCCLENGADDVLSLETGQALTGHRVVEAMTRAEIQAQKVIKLQDEAIDIQESAANEVDAARQTAQRNLQVAFKKVMWHLPGRLLESIPSEDSTLQERAGQAAGDFGGVGEYTFMAKLGRTVFGTVFKARSPQGLTVAVKVIHKSALKSVSHLFSVDQELCLMQNLPQHPNITRACAAMHAEKNIYLMMEYSGSVNLHHFILDRLENKGSMTEELVHCFIGQMAAAIAHLHNQMVCHRDLKPGNFVVSDWGDRLKLADFSLATMLCGPEQRLTQCCGSLPFVAPEIMRRDACGYDPLAADIWSLGMNFVELHKGPYSLEKLLGWVPQHPADPEKRLDDLERFEPLFASLPDAGMLGGMVRRMLRLRPEERIGIAEVLRSGGLTCAAPLPASVFSGRGCRAARFREDLARSAVAVRTVGCGEAAGSEAGGNGALLQRLGGVATVRAALDHVLDTALMDTVLGPVLDNCGASVPTLRGLYAEGVAEFFDCEPGTERAQAVLARMRAAHSHWTFSDADFDVLVEHFGAALVRMGVRSSTARQARIRFGALREAVTTNFYVGAAHAWRCDMPAWRAEVAAQGPGRAGDFAAALVGILAERVEFRESAPKALRSAEAVQAHFLQYLRGEARSPLPLDDAPLQRAQIASLLSSARKALVEAGWQPEEVCVLHFALHRECARALLAHELAKLTASADGLAADRACWMSLVLALSRAAQRCACTAPLCRQEAFLLFLAAIGAVLAEGACQDPERLLASHDRGLDLKNEQFDTLVELLRGVCADVLPAAANQAATTMLAMRPWVLSSWMELSAEGPRTSK